MSNSDSWRCFKELRYYWEENRKLLEEFSIFVKEKSDLDRLYGRGLERLCKLGIFDLSIPSLTLPLSNVKNSILEISNYFLTHSDFVQNDLYIKIKNILNTHENNLKDSKGKITKLFIEREKLVKKHNVCREKYWNSLKISEVNAFGKYFSPESSCLEGYKGSIQRLNNFNQFFAQEMTVPMRIFNESSWEKFSIFKTMLQNLITSEANCIYIMKMHVDKLAKAVDQIDFEKEQENIDKLCEKCEKIPEEVFISTKQENFHLESDLEKELDLPNYDYETRRILNNCWESIKLNEFDFEYFSKKMENLEGKKQFVLLMNEKRKLGQFTLLDENIKDLARLFMIVLDSLALNQNFACARQCIILSQTFSTKEKLYVQQFIINHPLWALNDFWDEIIEDSIDKEINALIDCENDLIDTELINTRNKSVIVSTLASYIDIMMSFNKNVNIISKIANHCKQKYDVTDEELPLNYIINISNS